MSRYSRAFPIIAPGEQLSALLQLPPHAFRLEAAVVEKMQKLGMSKIKSFIYMPPSVLRRRIGQSTLDQISSAWPLICARLANELMANIHNDGEFRHQMPLFLTPELEEFWVSEHFSDDDMQAVFDYCLPSELRDCHTVYSVRGKKPRPDGKLKFEFWRYENLPRLGNDEPFQAQISLFLTNNTFRDRFCLEIINNKPMPLKGSPACGFPFIFPKNAKQWLLA